MLLGDALGAKVAEERLLVLATPGVGLEGGELLLGVKVVLVAREDEADLVHVVAI